MSIRLRIVLIVLPLLITSLLIAQIITSFSARNGITNVATEFLRFKSEQLKNYSESQWTMLVENDLAENEQFIEVTQSAVESFARSLVRRDTELILGLNSAGELTMQTKDILISSEDTAQLAALAEKNPQGWINVTLEGKERVAWVSYFEPFDWYLLVTEQRETFYQAVNQIFNQTVMVIAIASAIAVTLLLIFSHYLTVPLRNVVAAMKDIISTNDLSKRVDVIYKDETGELGHSFNLMTGELQKAYDQIKSFALKAVVAQHKEAKIRNIFQKYVPTDVIDQFFTHPESMLVGEDRVLAVLFSDVRSFTSISEQMRPNEIVESLNTYFSAMVEIIMERKGIVDKYIGDAIMAFFGAPVKHDDDALQATFSGIEMIEALEEFNKGQRQLSRPEFRIGVGINYGLVTVGNIGSERKMDYTVIGDMVNLASRLEGLTKKYKEPLLVTESVQRKVSDVVPCRLLDRVIVKGKTQGVGIFAPKRNPSDLEKQAWVEYEQALQYYYNRDFRKAAGLFSSVQQKLPEDFCADMFYKRSEEYILSPPPDDWTGLTLMMEK